MIINHNIPALNTYRQMGINAKAGADSTEKLSSGLRINRAGDDAAGLAISEKMRGQIRGLDQSSRNAQDGISLIQTAEGGLNEIHSILQRMRELAVQASNGTSTTGDKQNVQDEVNQLTQEIDRIAGDTEFNTMKLLNGDLSKTSRYGQVTTNTNGGLSSVKALSTATVGSTAVYLGASGATAANAAVWSTATNFSGAGGATALTALSSGGTSLGLAVGDEINISAVVGGTVKNAVFVVGATSTLSDLAASIQTAVGASSASVVTASGGAGVAGAAGSAYAAGIDAWASSGSYSSGALVINGQLGASNDITSFSITAKDSAGASRTTFNTAVNGGLNGGLKQLAIAMNQGDYAAMVDVGAGGAGAANAGDSVVAVRANTTVTTSNLQVSFSTGLTSGGSGQLTIGSKDQSASIHIGANENQTTNVGINAMDSYALGLKSSTGVIVSVQTVKSAESAITTINNAISTVSNERSKVGALQNRLEHTINNLGTSSENLTAAESRIRDVDMASEIMKNTRNNILLQASQSMLAQANQAPQQVLQLLR